MPDIRYKPRVVRKSLTVDGKTTLENKARQKEANSKHYVTGSNGSKTTTLWYFQLHHLTNTVYLRQV